MRADLPNAHTPTPTQLQARAKAADASARLALRRAGCTKAEARAGVLWSQGLGAKEIARKTHSNVRTVEERLKAARAKAMADKEARDGQQAREVLRVFPNRSSKTQDPDYEASGNWFGIGPSHARIVDLETLLGTSANALLEPVELALR